MLGGMGDTLLGSMFLSEEQTLSASCAGQMGLFDLDARWQRSKARRMTWPHHNPGPSCMTATPFFNPGCKEELGPGLHYWICTRAKPTNVS